MCTASGRTGRAGKNGLAVTLAERNDSSMIRRIQHFTTQNIPVAIIAGLEPKNPEPRMLGGRPGGPDVSFGDRRPGGGKPPYGKPSYAKASYGKPFAPRGAGSDRAPFEARTPFEGARSGGFEPRGEGAPRGNAFDRGAPRRSGPAGPAGKPSTFRPSRPR